MSDSTYGASFELASIDASISESGPIDNTSSTAAASAGDGSFSFESSFLSSPQILKTLSDDQDSFNHLKYPRDLVTADIGGVPYAIIATPGDQSVQILDLTDPGNPQNTAQLVDGSGGFTTLANPHGLRVIEVDGESFLIVAAWGEDGVSIINISDPSNPSLASSLLDNQNGFDELDRPHGIAIEQIGDSYFAFVGSLDDNGIQVIDISDPYQPTAAASLTHGGEYTLESIKRISVAQAGSKTVLLAAAQGSNAIQIIDVTDPFNPSALSLVQSIEAPLEIKSIDIGGRNYAFAVSKSNNSVQIIDFTDPVNPTKLYRFQDGVDGFNGLGGVTDVDLITDGTSSYALFASQTDNSIEVANVTDPSSPIHISSISIDSPRHVDSLFVNNKVYGVVATNNPGGVSIVELGGFVDEVAVTVAVPPAPDLIAVSDSVNSGSDNLTRDTTPSFSGTAEAGSIVELFANGSSLGTTIVEDNGDWTFTVDSSSALADANYAITATATTGQAFVHRTPNTVASPGRTAQEQINAYAFAALKQDGSVITWGHSDYGGDSSSVSDQLQSGVSQIFSNKRAFAALKDDGSVITWGQSNRGGDSSSVSDQLQSGVSQIFSDFGSFAALKEDGSAISWGYTSSSSVSDQLQSGVSKIFSADEAFAALKDDGSVVTWGNWKRGGVSSSVSDQLQSGVSQIFSTKRAFAALKDDGSVITWGETGWGGNSSSVSDQLQSGVSEIFSTTGAFAARKDDGSVITWGEPSRGGDNSSVSDQLQSGVSQIFSTHHSFAALKDDGSVITWGQSDYGGDSSSVSDQLQSDVSRVFSNVASFAALKEDGSVISWGEPSSGGDSSSVSDQLQSGVSEIFSTTGAFAARKDDGSVITWGHSDHGGDSSSVSDQLKSGVSRVFSANWAFAALKDDSSVVTWGVSYGGGDSSNVADNLQSDVVSFADPFHDDRLVAATGPVLTSDTSTTLALTVDSTPPVLTYGTEEASLVENSGAGQVILSQSSTDYGSAVTYSLKERNSDDANAFSIDSNTGQVTLTDDPDYETKQSYSFTVVATDSAGNSTEQPLSLRVKDLDDTAPFLITQDTNLPIASNRHTDVGDGNVISVQFNVDDAQSTTKEIKAVFESPSGAQNRTIIIHPGNLTSEDHKITDNIFRKHFTLDTSNVFGGSSGSVEGGEWSIKELTLEDSLGNKQTINKTGLPDNLKFTVNNSPSAKPAFVGQKLIGQTLMIDETTIIDADNAGSPATDHQYQWLISDDGSAWTPVSDFSTTQTTYDLTEADANKYFKSIVKYIDGLGTAEVAESDPFKFTEFAVSPTPLTETFDASNNGWTYASGADVPIESRGSNNNYLGHLDYADQVKKTYNLQGNAYKIGLDFLKFNTWDTKYHHIPNGDTFSVQIDDQVLFTYRPNGDAYVSRPGDAAGYSWTMEKSTNGLSYRGERYAIDIDLPNPITEFDLQVNLDIDQRYTDEWGGIDNVRIYQEIPISGPEAAPIFSSLESATTVEKGGEGNIVYQASADDQSPFTYSLEGADPNLFSIDSNTGAVQLLEEANFDKRQIYDFTVRATDVFGNYADKSVNLAVEDSSLAFWKDGAYRVDAAALKDASPSVNAVGLKDGYDRALSDEISRSWDGVSVIKSNDGYRMLQVAERGRRRGHYRIAELNSNGVLQSVGAWVDEDQAVANRYQELFELDLNNDGQITIPSAVDVDLDGFADGLGHYRLIGNGISVDLSDDRGSTLSTKSSRNWNAVASKHVGDGFQVVIQGERGRRRSQYQVWSTDANGMVIDKSSWLDVNTLVEQGYEQTFNRDFNNDGSVYQSVSLVTANTSLYLAPHSDYMKADGLQVKSDPSLALSGEMTVSFWLNRDPSQAYQFIQGIFQSYMLGIRPDGRLEWSRSTSGSGYYDNGSGSTSGSGYYDNGSGSTSGSGYFDNGSGSTSGSGYYDNGSGSTSGSGYYDNGSGSTSGSGYFDNGSGSTSGSGYYDNGSGSTSGSGYYDNGSGSTSGSGYYDNESGSASGSGYYDNGSGSTSGSDDLFNVYGTTSIPESQWTHISAVMRQLDGGTYHAELWVDGQLDGSSSSTRGIQNTQNDFSVLPAGRFDNFQVWNKALDQSELQLVANNQTFGVARDSLIVEYTFENDTGGSGTSTEDSSGNSNHGLLSGENGGTIIKDVSDAGPRSPDQQVIGATSPSFVDTNSDGFVDDLPNYMLMGLSSSLAIDLTDDRGRRLTPKSSRSWNALSAAPNPDDPSSGFEVLIQGERGRRRSQYQVWSTDPTGQVTSKSSWLDGKTLAQQGYEATFTKDLDGDALIGAPSGSSLVDQDSNGLVDGITHYALLQGSGNTAQSIDLKDSRGMVLSDSSSRTWNVIQAADNGNGFDVLLQGERGRRQSQYLLWKADPTGLITEKSGWMTDDQLAFDGYESVFGRDLNDNETIGL